LSDTLRFTADKTLQADLEKAVTAEEIRALLENASVRSGIGNRDPQTGRFVAVETDAAAATRRAAVPPTEKYVERTVVIGGKQLQFEGTALEVEIAIRQAYEIANALQSDDAPAVPVLPRETRNTAFDHPVKQFLSEQGVDIDQVANEQSEKAWAAATHTFLTETPEGQAWPGGTKNMELAGNLLMAKGLDQAEDKVAALRSVAAEMAEKGLVFESDFTPAQAVEATADATPVEILQAWKEGQGADPEEANRAFIEAFRQGRSSGLFGK
jgi:hypothetical protein